MNDKTATLLSELHQGVRQLVASDEWARYLEVAARFHTYSPTNQLLIWWQRPDATRVAGYQRWQELGRQVRKGEKGIAILAPMTRKAHGDDCHGKKGCDCPLRLGGFKTAHVFDVAQTDGEPLPDPIGPETLTGDAPTHLWIALATQVGEAGFDLRRETTSGCESAFGVTDYTARVVIVRPDLDERQACKTLAHELAHVLLHDPARDDSGRARGVKEVEAESVAYVVLRRYGVDDVGCYSFGYLAGWAQGDPRLIEATAERVARTADEIAAKVDALVAA